MRKARMVKDRDVIKDRQRVLRGLEDCVKGIVVDVLRGIENNLSSDLHGIALEVIKGAIEFEILDLAGPKGQHLPERRYTRGGHNAGSVVIDSAREKYMIP